MTFHTIALPVLKVSPLVSVGTHGACPLLQIP